MRSRKPAVQEAEARPFGEAFEAAAKEWPGPLSRERRWRAAWPKLRVGMSHEELNSVGIYIQDGDFPGGSLSFFQEITFADETIKIYTYDPPLLTPGGGSHWIVQYIISTTSLDNITSTSYKTSELIGIPLANINIRFLWWIRAKEWQMREEGYSEYTESTVKFFGNWVKLINWKVVDFGPPYLTF
jgi:hypothetical protein